MKKDGNWAENFPLSPFVCFLQFSVALISIIKNPRPYGRGYILLYELL